MASLFNKKQKAIEWKHRFVFLANYAQQKIPTTDSEKDVLYKAGLGEKVVEFENMDGNAEDIGDLLYCVFPKLKINIVEGSCYASACQMPGFLSHCLKLHGHQFRDSKNV